MTTFDDLATITFHDHDGARFRVAQAGDGPDIVWVPGGDSPAHYWAEQFEWFHKDFRCTSYDPRGVDDTVPQLRGDEDRELAAAFAVSSTPEG